MGKYFLLAHLAIQNYSSVALVKSQSERFIQNSESCENYHIKWIWARRELFGFLVWLIVLYTDLPPGTAHCTHAVYHQTLSTHTYNISPYTMHTQMVYHQILRVCTRTPIICTTGHCTHKRCITRHCAHTYTYLVPPDTAHTYLVPLDTGAHVCTHTHTLYHQTLHTHTLYHQTLHKHTLYHQTPCMHTWYTTRPCTLHTYLVPPDTAHTHKLWALQASPSIHKCAKLILVVILTWLCKCRS